MSVKPTNIPQCHLRQSADSAGNFSRHGKLGELTENIRAFALPFESKPYTFRMKYKYDSFNRMQQMTYPDGEVVSYSYNLGGMLYSIEGDKGGQAYMYVKHIAYNQYELKESVLYGNGTLATFEWDNAGNMTVHRLHDECIRRMCWDEENRLQGVADCSYASLYQYDANGERTYKLTGQYSYQNINGRYYPYAVLDNPTLYASPYVVCTPKGYTKHYYAESERVASKIGNGCLRDLCKSLNTDADFNKEDEPENPYLKDCDEENELLFEKQERNCIYSKNVMACLESENFIAEKTLEGLYSRIECVEEGEDECYWYHPDHLGSSSWITFSDGKAVQHLHYLPWGEDFVNQRTSSFSSMYTFSAKEKDSETGFSYFGSRYYNSDLSIWLSVDPMADKYPSISPYTYCANNPVKLVDPNGEDVVILNAPQGAGGYGHMAAVIQDEEGNWYYMTMGAAENGNLSQVLSSGVGGGMTLESCGTKDMEEAIEFAKKDVNNSEYTQELVLQTSSKMDGKIYQSALDKQSNVNSGNEEYKALTNSCADAVKDVLEKGLGIDLPSKIDPRPNSYFNKLLKNKNKIQSKINVLKDGEKSGTKSKHP